MKRIVNTIIAAIFTTAAIAQDAKPAALTGSWSGKLNAGLTRLTVVLHLEQAGDSISASFDSPDQGAKGIPAHCEYLSDDSVNVGIGTLSASLSAHLSEGKLVGKFTQRGFSFPIELTRGVAEAKRPQQPQPPYPYLTEEVTFTNTTDSATLAATLTYPVGYEKKARRKPAVVLLVTGSGLQNRNEELFGHQPFHVIADYLARQGIATLRYDDRTTGGSKGGDVAHATTRDFMRDAAAGIDFLRETKAFSQVGCLGHSEGGAIAFMLGAQQKVDFIVSMAAPAVKGDTLMAAQVNRILALSLQRANMTAEKYSRQPQVQNNPWLRWFVDYDPSDDIRQTRCPVFALNGDRDCQVIATLNLPAIQRLLPHSTRHLVRQYPQLNHLFQHCTLGLPAEYGQIEETIAPEVLADIAHWINGL